jgi:hypothetical protein
VLSIPPAFILSQDQTLHFGSSVISSFNRFYNHGQVIFFF